MSQCYKGGYYFFMIYYFVHSIIGKVKQNIFGDVTCHLLLLIVQLVMKGDPGKLDFFIKEQTSFYNHGYILEEKNREYCTLYKELSVFLVVAIMFKSTQLRKLLLLEQYRTEAMNQYKKSKL